MNIQLQTPSRRCGLPVTGCEASTESAQGDAQKSSDRENSSSRPENGSSRRSESDGPKKPKAKYGSRPPKCPMSGAEVSQWILEAEREDRRLATAVRTSTCEAEQLECDPQPPRPIVNNRRPALRHRGCSFRLPTSKPINIPTIPYNPLDIRWMHQEFKRKVFGVEKTVPMKDKQMMRALTEAGFDVQLSDDVDFYDSDQDEYDENGKLQCPICSIPPKQGAEELEVATDVTPRGDDTAATIITTDTTTVIISSTSAASAKSANQKTGNNFFYEIIRLLTRN